MPSIPPELSASGRRKRPPDALDLLAQTDNFALLEMLGSGEWTVLYELEDSGTGNRCSYSALLSTEQVPGALSDPSWEVRIGGGAPGFSQNNRAGETVTTYERFGFEDVEPILHIQNFHDLKPRQFHISEEFRLFHNLYRDHSNNRYILVDGNGDDIIAVEMTPSRVRVRTSLLRQYMAARQRYLGIFFDYRANARVALATAKAALPPKRVTTNDRCYSFNVGSINSSTFSRLFGKRVVAPPPMEESGVWPFEQPSDQYVDFIIGCDEAGRNITHSCDPDALANYFGANEEAPHYLTPVWFNRKVLSRYYDEPNKYTVEDGYLRCGALWGLQLDNNAVGHVVVYLGDLGRDLSHSEQTHWRLFNVSPSDNLPSETNFRRSFLAQFTDPSAPDLVFRQRYVELQEAWTAANGWALFRPAHESDSHLLKQLRVPATDSLGEFETQVLYLVKLLVDALNTKELAKACPGAPPDEKSLAKLERYLSAAGYPHRDRDMRFLRLMQALRSKGAAHAKGRDFERLKAEVGLDRNPTSSIFSDLLSQANLMLSALAAHFIPADSG